MLALPAWAHEQAGQAAGFVTGLLHPVSGLDHVLAMVAVGLWGAQLGAPAIWLLPVTFPLVMAFGGFLGLLGVPLPGVEVGIAASAILLGAMVATESRPPLWMAAAAVGVLRDLPRPRARHRVAGRAERPALQHRLRGRHRVPARDRDRDRVDPPLAAGADRPARRGRRGRGRRGVLPLASGRVMRRAPAAVAGAGCCWRPRARTPTSSTRGSARSTTASRTSS